MKPIWYRENIKKTCLLKQCPKIRIKTSILELQQFPATPPVILIFIILSILVLSIVLANM